MKMVYYKHQIFDLLELLPIEEAGIIIRKDLRWLALHVAHISLCDNFCGDHDELLESQESRWIDKIMGWKPDDLNLSKWSRLKNKIYNTETHCLMREPHELIHQLALNVVRGIRYLKQRYLRKENENAVRSLLKKTKKDLERLGYSVSVESLEAHLLKPSEVNDDLNWLEWVCRDETRLGYLRDEINNVLRKHNLYPEYNALSINRITY